MMPQELPRLRSVPGTLPLDVATPLYAVYEFLEQLRAAHDPGEFEQVLSAHNPRTYVDALAAVVKYAWSVSRTQDAKLAQIKCGGQRATLGNNLMFFSQSINTLSMDPAVGLAQVTLAFNGFVDICSSVM